MYNLPDAHGHFGPYGGTFTAGTLPHVLDKLRDVYARYQHDPEFIREYEYELKHFIGHPSSIYHAHRLVERCDGTQIYLKREDLNHTGVHKVNNVIGQALLVYHMDKPRMIAEVGAGQYGVAIATVAVCYGMECVVYMDSEDVRHQATNVYRMKLLGATMAPVESGSRAPKNVLNEATRDWVTNVVDTFHIIGTVTGPRPYPMMMHDLQTVTDEECKAQMPEMTGRQPDAVIACVGGGPNTMDTFYPYVDHTDVKLIDVKAADEGIETDRHAASPTGGSPDVLYDNRTYLLQDGDGQIIEMYSILTGFDYPGVGPEYTWSKDVQRAECAGITDKEALQSFHNLCHMEDTIPALESNHALAYVCKLTSALPRDRILLVNLSDRGDRDMHTVVEVSGIQL